MSPKKEWFTWTIEIQVDPIWVADGFELDDERATDMLNRELPYADGHEFKAKVLTSPRRRDILTAQGFTTDDRKKKAGVK